MRKECYIKRERLWIMSFPFYFDLSKEKDIMSEVIYRQISDIVDSLLRRWGINFRTIKVSGVGSPWITHVPVDLYNQRMINYASLMLPCAWDRKTKRFEVKGKRRKIGRNINKSLEFFSESTGKDAFQELEDAMLDPRKNFHYSVSTHSGEYAINAADKSDYLIVITEKDISSLSRKNPLLDTWNRFPHENKMNINLSRIRHQSLELGIKRKLSLNEEQLPTRTKTKILTLRRKAVSWCGNSPKPNGTKWENARPTLHARELRGRWIRKWSIKFY